MSERGLYIVGEGADFTGKTTQFDLLKQAWADRDDVIYVREPGGTPAAEELRHLILHSSAPLHELAEFLAFTAGRVDLWFNRIEPALADGMTVVSDRNWFSSLGYQGAHGTLSVEMIEAQTRLVLPPRYITPDKTFVLTVSSEEKARRKRLVHGASGKGDKIEQRDEAYFARVNAIYETLVIGRLGGYAINGGRSKLDVHADVLEFAEAA